MGFASNQPLVDATIGHPYVVTMGVREQVVKPATEFTGSFAMGRITESITDDATVPRRRLRDLFAAAIFSSGLVLLQNLPLYAASTTAQFRVTARVIKSCKVSSDTLASQAAANANGTIKVNCQNSPPPTSSNGGGALPSGTATVNYSVDEVSGSGGALKVVTINY